MPLHFYEIKDWSKLDVVKPFVSVMIECNHGGEIYWSLDRKETIKELKIKLTKSQSPALMNLEGTHLYLVRENHIFDELCDDDTVEIRKIKDGDKLYYLAYRWSFQKCTVTLYKDNINLQGMEGQDTCLGIKVKVQDQTAIPVKTLKLFYVLGNSYEVQDYYFEKELTDEIKPSTSGKAKLVAFTNEELQAEYARMEKAATTLGKPVNEYLFEQEKIQKEAKLRARQRFNFVR